MSENFRDYPKNVSPFSEGIRRAVALQSPARTPMLLAKVTPVYGVCWLFRRRQLVQLRRPTYHIVSGSKRHQPEVVDSVADHVTRLSPDDARPYFLCETPDVTSSGPLRCCDVTRRSGNPPTDRGQTTSRDLLTLDVPTLTSHGGASHLRLIGNRMDRCCSHLAVLPLLPPPPARTCVTWTNRTNQLVDVESTATTDEQTRDAAV